MCLFSKNQTPMVADHDIVCYKLVTKKIVKENGRGITEKVRYYTPYMHEDITNEIVYKGEYDVSYQKVGLPKEDRGTRMGEGLESTPMYEIGKGYIHSFSISAITRQYNIDNYSGMDSLIERNEFNLFYECVIPKGTEYYQGDGGYASRKIVFGKIFGMELSDGAYGMTILRVRNGKV